MIRIYGNADRKYIDKLLDEIEKDEDFMYEISISEHRADAVVDNISISARKVESINF